ncbi:hypothetical protein, partial [Alicyclobacillus shizuokensis]|uniref:hypothetical protein n=1 Tax=Alicyclobacillus shizuokensis TaxID=392014 RepID=UPI001C3F2742
GYGAELSLPERVFRNLKMQKNAALRYTALFIFMQFGQRFLMSLTPPFVQQAMLAPSFPMADHNDCRQMERVIAMLIMRCLPSSDCQAVQEQ